MSQIDKLMVTAAKDALEVIGDLSQGSKGRAAQALAVLEIINAIVETVRQGFARTIPPAEVQAAIEEARQFLANMLAANDKAADDALNDKFPVAPATPIEPVVPPTPDTV